MENCDLSFEKSSVNVSVNGKIDSIKNPLSGKIIADEICNVIKEPGIVNPSLTQIIKR